MTYLEILNNVQRRLRTTVTNDVEQTDYDILLSHFIDDSKEEFEDLITWEMYKEILSVSTADQDDLVNLGSTTTNKTVVFKGFNGSSQSPLNQEPLDKIIQNQLYTTPTTGSITGYHWSGTSSSDETVEVHLYPRASGVQTLKFWVYNPPAKLYGQAGTVEYRGPGTIIALGAYARAVAERGDDGGTPYNLIKKEYDMRLTSLAQVEAQRSGAFDWFN